MPVEHRPLAERPVRLSFCYSAHAQKGAELALEVLTRVREAVPTVEVVVFGAVPPQHDLPDWVTYRTRPSQRELVDEIYNASRVFLCTSRVEGFGLPNVEAMACGAALVTTDNGGSRDYARHGDTALVADCHDPDVLSGHVVQLLEDDARRVEIAAAGHRHVRRFDWERTGELLEEFLERYVAEPVAYGWTGRRS